MLRSFGQCLILACATGLAAGANGAEVAAPATPEQEKFFEQTIRPILANQCWECHGSGKQESGLRLDSRDLLLRGGDSNQRGAVPGDADNSQLIRVVNHIGDIHMPPEKKLSDDQIAALKKWVSMGLPWPASASSASPPQSMEQRIATSRSQHWSLQEVARPELPPTNNPGWSQRPLDRFVLAKLQQQGLEPSPLADRGTLLRRVSFDLLGLPPAFEDVASFQQDTSPDAYERQVDRILASPRYGERWGRHWLDVARYADTTGYTFDNLDRRFPYSYTYRDWVIDALNQDLPYDQFVLQQLAADHLPRSAEARELAAMGFLTTGRKFNNFHDDMDDQIDVVTRGLLGLTVGCARCHDHKYDPIPTEDYYSLFGVFASSKEPPERPLIGPLGQSVEYQAFQAELQKKRDAIAQFDAAKRQAIVELVRQKTVDCFVRAIASEGEAQLISTLSFLTTKGDEIPAKLVERWKKYLSDHARPEHPIWGLWSELVPLGPDGFAEKAAPILARFQALPVGLATGQIHPKIKAAFAAETPGNRYDVVRIYGKAIGAAYAQWQGAGSTPEALAQMPDDQRQLAELLLAPGSPTDLPLPEIQSFFNREIRSMRKKIEKDIETFQTNSPDAPPRAMALYDKPDLNQAVVLIRGNPGRPGKQVPRQFLVAIAGENRRPFAHGSGRLELAQAIIDPKNPLTRRVLVNRLWLQHFGQPLVATPSDFGLRASPPTHPEMLDALATSLLDRNWSLKDLHRNLVTSATYRQQSVDRPEGREKDPENRLLWRMNRKRLELEPMRDSLFAAADQLDFRQGGKPVELTKEPFANRRSVYGFLDRQDLPGFFRVFDIASPDQSTAQRPTTSVPQQALFFLNSPLVTQQAQALLNQAEIAATSDPAEKISALYRHVFSRQPTAEEQQLGRQFVESLASPAGEQVKLSPWQQYAQLLLSANEFMFVD